jgi:hypothetical protein
MFLNNLHTLLLHSRFPLTFEAIYLNCDQVMSGAKKSHRGEDFELRHISEEERHRLTKIAA